MFCVYNACYDKFADCSYAQHTKHSSTPFQHAQLFSQSTSLQALVHWPYNDFFFHCFSNSHFILLLYLSSFTSFVPRSLTLICLIFQVQLFVLVLTQCSPLLRPYRLSPTHVKSCCTFWVKFFSHCHYFLGTLSHVLKAVERMNMGE